jgi:hypothetical protein
MRQFHIEHYGGLEGPLHFHSPIELLLVEEGKAEIWIGDEHLTLYGGQMAVVTCYCPHHFYAEAGSVRCTDLFIPAVMNTDLQIPAESVMPSVTPVCFASMYTGAMPEIHGIRKYTKPVLTTDTLFDAAIRAGKKCAIVAESDCSIAKIFLERELDYFIYDTIDEVNAKAPDLIEADEHDLIVVYNGNYDSTMHKCAPESTEALAELKRNSDDFAALVDAVRIHWKGHNTFYGYCPDHGCHEIDGKNGSHGLDQDEDMLVIHMFGTYIG